MTLPASGNPIKMSQVLTELQLGGQQIDLNGNNPTTGIRSLFGVTTLNSQIAMSNGYGKTFVTYTPPFRASTTTGTWSNPTYAWDNNASTCASSGCTSGTGGNLVSASGTISGFVGPSSYTGYIYVTASATMTSSGTPGSIIAKLVASWTGGSYTLFNNTTTGNVTSQTYKIPITNVNVGTIVLTANTQIQGDGIYLSKEQVNVFEAYVGP